MKRLLIIFTVLPLIAVIGYLTSAVVVEYDRQVKLEQIPVKAVVQVVPVTPVKTYRHDPELATVMTSLGLDYSKLNLIYAPAPNQSALAQAIYDGVDTIYLNPDHDATIVNRILSHEYIHHIQNTRRLGATSFYPYLETLYGSNYQLQRRMTNYSNNSACLNGCNLNLEVQAVACTELPDSQLDPSFIKWCNAFLPKRASLFN